MFKSFYSKVMLPFKVNKCIELSKDIEKIYDELIVLTQKDIESLDQLTAKVKADYVKHKCDEWRKTWKMEPSQDLIDVWSR